MALASTGIAKRLRPRAAAPAIQTDIPSLCQSLSADFPVGAAIWLGDISGPHSDLLKQHFNSITAENDMKWEYLEPGEGKFTFGVADALVAFARANHMLVRGHNLAWHEQNPKWLFEDANGKEMQPTPENKALLLRRLQNHIRAVVSHFGDDVYVWDVVNEVIDPAQPDGFRRSPWFLITGTDYIDAAFRTAREVAPHAKLYINDYDTTDLRKRAFLLKLVQDLKGRGVPVDGVGHQMHIDLDHPSTAEITRTIQMFSALGIDNQITELDVSVYDNRDQRHSSAPKGLLLKQGYRYEELFDTFRKLQGKISAVTFWGIADDHTWLTHFPVARQDWPLLFDERLQAKPAYWGVVDPWHLPPKN
ncbi:MAG TPA: endo-1,4-beta-xylanase [Candidatus Acidoferrales bacterium]|nr:endo-1,4-beta-xylanase [Candidatus Acidoferrales bacterium]